MAVAFDGEAIVSAAVNFGNPITLASKTTAGTNRAGVVVVSWEDAAGASISSVTWNGVSMGAAKVTQVNDLSGPATSPLTNASIYVIENPPTGASSVVITFSDDVRGGAAAIGFNGVDQATLVRAGSTVGLESDTGGSKEVTVNAQSGDMAVDAVMDVSVPGATVHGSQTQTHKLENTAGGEHWSQGSYEALSGSSVAMTYTTTDYFVIAALALQASGGAAAPLEARGLGKRFFFRGVRP